MNFQNAALSAIRPARAPDFVNLICTCSKLQIRLLEERMKMKLRLPFPELRVRRVGIQYCTPTRPARSGLFTGGNRGGGSPSGFVPYLIYVTSFDIRTYAHSTSMVKYLRNRVDEPNLLRTIVVWNHLQVIPVQLQDCLGNHVMLHEQKETITETWSLLVGYTCTHPSADLRSKS